MTSHKLVMLSPHHADTDYRLLRSVEVMAQVFDHVDLVWDDDYPGHQKIPLPYGDKLVSTYTKIAPRSLLCLVRKQGIFESDIEALIKNADIVYIHASAIEGLLYAREAKRLNSAVHVVFDYHDSLTYELFYQLKKIGLSSFYRLLWPLYKSYPKRLGQNVDSLIGISTTQTRDFIDLVGKSIPNTSVPNFRKFSSLFEAPRKAGPQDSTELVWLGTVMEGRDLSLLADWVKRLPTATKLHVFGHVLNQSAVDMLTELLGDNVVFYGKFKNEADILPKLPAKAIGVFLGWNDPQGTAINGHASPNKYFTYVNMEIPVIISASLSELARNVADTNAGLSIHGPDDFARAVADISADYDRYANGIRKLKAFYSETDPKDTLAKLLIEVRALISN